MDTYAYNPPKPKNKVILFVVVFLILCVIAIIVYLVNLEDEEYPDAPAPSSGSTTTGSTTTGSTTTGSTTTGSSTTGSSSDGSISDFTPNSSICDDSDNEYVSVDECADITNGKKCGGEDGKGGRWVNSKSKGKAVLCKWKDDECVTGPDCESDTDSGYNTESSDESEKADDPADENTYTVEDINFCQKMIDEKEVIPIGVDGATGGTMNDEDRDKYTDKQCNNMYRDNAITYPPVDEPTNAPEPGDKTIADACELLVYKIEDKLDAVKEISKNTIPDILGESSGKCNPRTNCTKTKERGRNTFRNKLQDIISEMYNKLKDLECTKDENIFSPIVDKIKYFNVEFIQEKEDSESEKYTGKGYSNVNIEFEDINWPFKDVKSLDDLEEVLNDSESFKNYEPYHNGNSRSSRKVPKPHDEHFVNFRSY